MTSRVMTSLATGLALTFILLPPAPARAAGPDQQVARDVLSDRDYQTSLPDSAVGSAGAHRTQPGSDGERTGEKQGDQPPADPSHDPSQADPSQGGSSSDIEPGAPQPPPAAQSASATTLALLKLLPALILTAFVILLVYLALRAFQRRRKATAPREAPLRPAITELTTATPAAAALPEWQLLADQGRFNDAIHVLLLHLLSQLRHDRSLTPSASHTSREILRMEALPPAQRPGLATIIGAVEFCHFGGRPAGQQLFQHCVDAYHQVVTAPAAGNRAG